MKKSKYIFIFIPFLITNVSCVRKNISTDETISSEETINIISANDSDFSYLSGYWVRKDYIESLKKDMSPKKAFVFLGDFSSLLIDENTKSFPLEIGISLNNTEAFNAEINLVNNKTKISFNWDGNGIETELKLRNRNLHFVFKGNEYVFTKIDNLKYSNDLNLGINTIANRILLRKEYDCYDENNILLFEKVCFNDLGFVKNFFEFSEFEFQTSFETDIYDHDIILFKTKNNLKKMFHFNFNNGILLLHEIIFNPDEIENEDETNLRLRYILKPI
jgi:hypothetical protein